MNEIELMCGVVAKAEKNRLFFMLTELNTLDNISFPRSTQTLSGMHY